MEDSGSGRRVLVLLLLILISRSLAVNDARHFYKWDVEYMFWSPDSVENVVMGINGQFPGPTIRAQVGDYIHVELTNKLHTEVVVIHWHGIRQIDSPWADGTAAISQCFINPGETFTYRLVVDRPGTYFYHGYYGMQRSEGLYGSLIVDREFDLLLSDWRHWRASVFHQEVGLSSPPMRWIGEPRVPSYIQGVQKPQAYIQGLQKPQVPSYIQGLQKPTQTD